MKKMAGILMAMVLLLGGCGEKSAAEPFDPAETAQALLDSGAFTDQLAQISNQVAVTLYGLDADTLSDDSVVYVSSGASAEELAVLQFTDDSAAESAVSLLKQRVEKQTAACQDYLPDEILKLSSAITEVRGNTAVLVVAADASAAQKVLDGES